MSTRRHKGPEASASGDARPVVLLITNGPTETESLRVTLEPAGFTLSLAKKGTHAQDLIQTHNPALILLDLPLPEGRVLCEQIRQDNPARFLPIIALAADPQGWLSLAGTPGGADTCLPKPVEGASLLAHVRAFLSIQKRLDRAMQIAEELRTLTDAIVRNVAHELRTPVLQIKSAFSLLAEDLRAGNFNGYHSVMDMAEQAIGRMGDTVNDLNQLSETQRLKQEPFSLNECVDLAIRNLERRLNWIPQRRDHCNRIRKCYDPHHLPPALGDKVGITRVLEHLLDNALKFSPKDSPVEMFIRPQEDRLLWIAVHDFGIGIPEEQLERIFEPYYQVDASTTRPYDGSGVGLAIVRLILDNLGAPVHVESQPGKGTTVSFTLPQANLT